MCGKQLTFLYTSHYEHYERDFKGHKHNAAVRKDGTITQCCFNDGPALKTVGQH